MPTLKQKLALSKIVENHGNIGKAMIEAGYDETTAKNPKNLTESKGWKELLEKTISDKKLVKVLDEGLEATKGYGENEQSVQIPDYAVRHKYLETGLKLKNLMPKDKPDSPLDDDLKVLLVQINNVITGQSRNTP